jgi:hypothetical protein
MLLHDDKELDDDLRRRPDHDLPLATLLGIVHRLESIIQHADSHHPYLKNNKQYHKGYRGSLSETITQKTGCLICRYKHNNFDI